ESPLSYFDEGGIETMMIFAGQAALILENNRLIETLKSDNTTLREELISRRFGELIGSCDAMQEIYQKISKIAQTDVSALITGETGTGKELIAKELHRRSNRKDGPFVTVNCAAIPENLLESELFGHMRGAFTGAYTTTVGKFQAASGGTLFLDEVGELPLNLQVKILRAIQEKQVQRVGALKAENVDIRIITATNRDLAEETTAGRFREDLYYRLNVVNIKLPPLRERDEDILLLARYSLQKYAKEFSSKARGFSPEAIRAMKKYSWPGNIRELDNVVRKAVIFAEGSVINSGDLDLGEGVDQKILPLIDARENFEMEYILSVLKKNGGNRTKTARDLGVDPRTIFRYLEKEKEGAG
ncbi:MAG: sigma-54-dependent Fis family transcriptional regulator, partial [Deltaproteobacteria bacterium]|nr:sigma-54-dependent Fis family transcriptional regulator [Deltaproteobacteria bacterium]